MFPMHKREDAGRSGNTLCGLMVLLANLTSDDDTVTCEDCQDKLTPKAING